MINLNIFDNIYIYNLLSKEKISLEKLDIYLNKLCKSIITDFGILKIKSDFFKTETLSIDIQSSEDRKVFENLIKSFIFNQVVNRSYNYLKNKKNNLNSEKYLKLIEFIRKYCMNKIKQGNDLENSDIIENKFNFDLEFHQNDILNNPKSISLENQIKSNLNISNNTSNENIPNILLVQNLPIPNITVIPNIPSVMIPNIQNVPNIQGIPMFHGIPGKIENISMFTDYNNILVNNPVFDFNNNKNNNNFIMNNNYNCVNSLLGTKTLRSNNTFVNNCEIMNNNSQGNAYELIMQQNRIINDLLGYFNNFRFSMCNNGSYYTY